MCDVGHRRGNYRQMLCEHRRNLKLIMTRKRAYPDRIARLLDEGEPANTVDIDQDRGSDQPEVEHWYEGLPAGKNLSLAPCLSLHSDALDHAVDNYVLKCWSFHNRRTRQRRRLLTFIIRPASLS